MVLQPTFASLAYDTKRKKTRREKFLGEMDEVMPWEELMKLVGEHYPKAGNGRQPMPLERMLRIYFLQQWYGLSDPGMEDALYDSEAMRRFAGIDLVADVIPDETTILNFRHLLEEHRLTERIFEMTRGYLSEKGLLVREGTIVDATIITAPASTKNASRTRDPEMKQTKKGNQWYFGMKAHVGTDTRRGVVHSIVVTNAAVHDSQVMEKVLHGEERALYGDKAYANKGKSKRGTRLPGGETPAGLPQGEIQGLTQECCSGLQPVCPGQAVSGAQGIIADEGVVCPKSTAPPSTEKGPDRTPANLCF